MTARRTLRVLLVAGALLACTSSTRAAVTPSFQILSTPASWGANVEAVGVAADGSVVIGKYFLSGTDPTCNTFGGCTRTFRWTAATGVQDLGLLDATEALAHDLSADGSLIVGEASSRIAYRRAFIWTAATGMQDLGTPLFVNDPDHSRSEAFGTSGNGAVIVGRAIPTQTSLIPLSFRFTTAVGFGFLTPTLPNEIQGEADGVSDDGSVVVGISYDTNTFLGRAFRWKAGVIQDLGNVAGPPAYAFAASSDGSTVVGLSGSGGSGSTAFRWTTIGGMQGLGNLGGDFASSSAADVSADGSVVVGSAPMLGLTRAFRWTTSRGIEDLNAVLPDQGVSLNGYQLVFADAVSADGTVIVGMAENLATHVDVAYRAVVPTPRCAPVTCAALGKNCGSLSNGCGGTLTCGTCSAPATCGGGGKANVCGGGCTPTTCAAQAKNCGAILDGCGGWIACGTCTAPQVCGGSGTPGVCGTPPPIPKTLTFSPNAVVGGNPSTGTIILTGPAPAGGAVVTLSSSFPTLASVPPNVTVAAGATSANYTVTTTAPAQDSAANLSACLNGQCVTSTLFVSKPTSCTPTTCAAQGKNCGSISNGCAGTLNCGTCTAPNTCGGGGIVNVCGGGCTPTTCAAQGKNCGTISDGCGGTLTCGTCTTPQTCGGGGTPNVCGGGSTAQLTLAATGRSGETVSSSPAGLSVPVGSTGSASFAAGSRITLSVSNDRDAIWSGVCSSGGSKTKTCSFTLNANASETANVQ